MADDRGNAPQRATDPPDDGSRALVARASHGDAPAIAELLERHLPAVRVFVRLHLGSKLREREAASDIVQDVCVDLLADLSGFDYRGEAEFRHWLCKAARNKIRDRDKFHHAERRDLGRETEDGDARIGALYGTLLTPSRVALANETARRLEAAFDELSEDHREVILLCRVAGLSQDAAAARMGRTVDSVRNLLHRALARLAGFADPRGGGGAAGTA